jgi:tyrosyl-tRNA synthetase
MMDYSKRAYETWILTTSVAPIVYFLNKAISEMNRTNSRSLMTVCEKMAKDAIENPRPLGYSFHAGASRYAYPPMRFAKGSSVEERYARVLSVGTECIESSELFELLKTNDSPVAYDGFEPSGRMHIAQGIIKKNLVNKMTSAGFTYIFWIADCFAFLNNKMGGDIDKIRTVGRYFMEVWKATGMNMDRVKFLWASKEMAKYNEEYMQLWLDISRKNSLARLKKCGTIMGRQEEDDSMPTSQIVYPVLQCADIFLLQVDVCQLGLDQKKVNMLAREYAKKTNRKKPIVLSHRMLAGLKQGQEKMSKSDPDSAIFMEDTKADIERKIFAGFCPEGNTLRSFVLPRFSSFYFPFFFLFFFLWSFLPFLFFYFLPVRILWDYVR